ncbi:MAG: aldehyde dehydrogenase family protein, partial [Flavobacteriales bacterium]
IEPDADVDSSLPLLVKAGYYHAGQVCVSAQKLYVHNSIVKDYSQKFKERVASLNTGNPLSDKTHIGPLIREEEVDRVDNWVKEAEQKGGDILCGGKRLSNNCYAPTLILVPPEEAEVSKKEIFGPVVCIYSYKNLNEAVQRANSLPFCFQSSIFTKDMDKAFHCVRDLSAKAVMVNDHPAFRVDWMPFGGAKRSGMGTGGIPYTMKEMTREKLMVMKSEAWK